MRSLFQNELPFPTTLYVYGYDIYLNEYKTRILTLVSTINLATETVSVNLTFSFIFFLTEYWKMLCNILQNGLGIEICSNILYGKGVIGVMMKGVPRCWTATVGHRVVIWILETFWNDEKRKILLSRIQHLFRLKESLAVPLNDD